MGPITGNLGPLEYGALDDFDPGLLAARETFAERWDIYRLSWGLIAVPAGATVYAAVDADRLAAKLRAHRVKLPAGR